jgi:hypothetical protein
MRLPPLTLVIPIALAAACGEAGKPATSAQPATAPAPAVDAVGEAAASYRVVASIAPPALPRGGQGALTLDVELTRPDVHVQQEFPLKVTLSTGTGVALAKETLGHADAVDPAAKGRRWRVPLTAKASGVQEVQASLRFALCKETEPLWCVTRNETVRARLEVR